MNKQRYIIYLFCILMLSIVSCSEEEEMNDVGVLLPSNLVLNITKDANIEGKVLVTATANNANFYSFIFYDAGSTQTEESSDGQANYTFSATGSFSIVARAHTTVNEYIETRDTVTVLINAPGNNGNPPDTGYVTPMTYPNYSLVWNDEFDGTALNTANWNYEIGTGNSGWGNNELQYYRQDNASVANGILTIEAKRQFFGSRQFTSSRLTTEGKQSFKYGRIDVRAAMPFGQGLWPAIWMLGSNFRTAGWPKCGEIDIMEMVGGDVAGGGDNVTHGTAHWWNDNTSIRNEFGRSRTLSDPLANNWHVYSIVWDSTQIRWLIDDIQYNALDITDPLLAEFRNPFFFILNVAVGGNWPGSPNQTTVFPQKMFVDYVRVFQ